MYKTFEEIIEEQQVPNHASSFELISGTFQIEPQFSSSFEKLFRPRDTTKTVGNGEVAIYWLLHKRYGGKYDVQNNPDMCSADLLIGDTKVEVKSWHTTANKRIKIGRFESFHDLRRMINIILGAYNVFFAGSHTLDKHGKSSYLSEASFGMNGLTRAFECALKIQDVPSIACHNIKEILKNPIYDGLTTASEYATATLAVLAASKLKQKIGPHNYIINIPVKKQGVIEVIKLGSLDIKDCNFQMVANDGVRVHCSELFVNLEAFV